MIIDFRILPFLFISLISLFWLVPAHAIKKDVGFKDTSFWIKTELRKNSKKSDEIRFSICDQNGKCSEISPCWYQKDELAKSLIVFGATNFNTDANALLSGSLLSTMNSCDFQKDFLSWISIVRSDCKSLKGFDHCNAQENCVDCRKKSGK